MSGFNAGFFVKEALTSTRRGGFMGLLAIGSMAMALMSLGAYWLARTNADRILRDWEDRIEVVAYFKSGLTPDQVQAGVAGLRALPGAVKVDLITPDEAARELSRDPQLKRYLDVLGQNPLPASARIQVKDKTDAFLADFGQRASRVPGVDSVEWGREAVRRLLKAFQVVRLLLGLAGVVLVLASLLIVGNVIRLTVFARREEISIMKLVGASNFFVRGPFLVEGCLHGLLAGVLASGILFALGRFLDYQARTQLGVDLGSFLPCGMGPALAAQLSGAGLALGLVGSLFSVGRFLRE